MYQLLHNSSYDGNYRYWSVIRRKMFTSEGKIPVLMDWLKICESGEEITRAEIFKNLAEILISIPGAFEAFKFWNNLRVFNSDISLKQNNGLCRSLACDCSPSSYSETAMTPMQGKLKMNIRSLSVSELLEYGR